MHTRIAGILVAVTLLACTASDREAVDSAAADTARAVETSQPAGVSATVLDAAGRELGVLTISESGNGAGLSVSGTLRGLPPGTHGLHFHTVGACEPPFTSAGDHWNPTSRQHGIQNPNGAHFGDLANIEVGADSSVSVQTSSPGGTLRGDNALLDADGAAIVVHAAADDLKTDPSGNSGARIACGRVG